MEDKAFPGQLKNIPELNGVRGIAVLAVFFHHAFYASLGSILVVRWGAGGSILARVFEHGDSGVDLFFVLSGFLITSLLFRDRYRHTYYRDFYWKRLLRIGPVLLVALVITVAMREFKYALLAALFLANFSAPLHIAGTAPFWSLAIEEQFYLLWPTVIRRSRVDRLLTYTAGVAFGSFILRCALGFIGHSNYHLSPLRLDGLALGALLALLRFRRGKIGFWFILGGSGLGVFCLALYSWLPHFPFGYSFWQLGTVMLSAAFVAICVDQSGASYLSVMRSRTLLFFAEISYAFYIFHPFIFKFYDWYVGLPAVGDQRAFWTRIAALFLATTMVSIASRYLVELPMLRLRTKVLKHPHSIDPTVDPKLPLAQIVEAENGHYHRRKSSP